jgi:hypothetical protein
MARGMKCGDADASVVLVCCTATACSLAHHVL